MLLSRDLGDEVEFLTIMTFQARPPYRRNDYLGWIGRARRIETSDRRLDQMLEELARGDRYMKLPYRPARARGPEARH